MKRTSAILLAALVGSLLVAQDAEARGPWIRSPESLSEHRTPGRFGIGVALTGQNTAPDGDDENELHQDGGSLFVRWRFARRWSLELASTTLHADLGGGAYKHDSKSGTLSVKWHIGLRRLRPRWDSYLLFGLGSTQDHVVTTNGGSERTYDVDRTHAHFGLGIERRWGRLGIGAELRFVGLSRADQDENQIMILDPVPDNANGSLMNLTATYYFGD